MSELATKIIEAALAKKPTAIKEAVNQLMEEKVKAVIESIKPEFGTAVLESYGADDSDETDEFFEAFHLEYGHLPEDEQMALLEELEAEALEEDDLDEGFVKNVKAGYNAYKDDKKDDEDFDKEMRTFDRKASAKERKRKEFDSPDPYGDRENNRNKVAGRKVTR
tara:strand:- start:5 stop:499 length:495 start_codon:yes stop_codon:yes gene_type:complete